MADTAHSGPPGISRIVSLLPARASGDAWWPGTREEILIGAILTQQTRWESVERALSLMREAGCSSLEGIHRQEQEELEHLIRCTGFFRQKAGRLKALSAHILSTYGGIGGMEGCATEDLRRDFLSLRGIGEETADSMLCYALGRPTFVVDAYTERICRCAGVEIPRKDLKGEFEAVLPRDAGVYRDVHARIVEYAKAWCGGKRCEECRIRNSGE
ncbi:MAG: Fe-S cluster assembly protein HesB [Methanomicrobiales archaeon]|nr:Fe-S cluster assembly protein HesB [Methanomicrobiales archaeon]